ncbi:MAG: hypothetical protein ABIK68_20880 [bacterium]
MLNRLFKNCLIATMACAMAAPVMAADISATNEKEHKDYPEKVAASAISATVNGRTRVWLEQVGVKNSTTTMQMKADGRFGASISAEGGGWTATAFQNMDLDSDDGNASPTIREQTVTLGNATMDITLGRFTPYGVTKGMAYSIGPVSDSASFWVGENVPTTDVTDHLTLGLKNVGLTFIVGMNNYNDSTTVGDARNETMLGAVYNKTFGPVDLGVEVLSASAKVDDKDADAVKNGAYDGQAYSALALGVGYAISDTVGLAFNYENNSNKAGTSGAKADKNTIMELWLDLGLNDTSGISVSYSSKTNDNGSANKGQYTLVSVSYLKQIGIANVFANYLGTTSKDDDTALDSTTTTVALGMEIDF